MYALHLVLTLMFPVSAAGAAAVLGARPHGRQALACSTALVAAFAVALGVAHS
ncbi:hypothetical protein ABZX93_33365 [Streptomyces sp. NPDC006632]|uniref:hypothetical protein n=1 Tax=Streptomyces sp. NPDC006632 TaxID=3157182 RepID=UPI0033B2E743